MKLNYDEPLYNFAFYFNLRYYVSGRKEAAAVADTHVRAMAAANMDQSLPRNARRYEGLTQLPKQAPTRARRVVGKQLDPR